MKIILTGTPKSTNMIYKSVCRGNFPTVYLSKEGKDLKTDYQWQIKSQWHKKPIKGEVGLDIDLYFNDKRKHDIDNYNKLICDSMTNIIYEDDSQITELTIRKFYDKKQPRAEIEIYEY